MKKKKVDTEIYLILLRSSLGFPGGSVVKNPPANAGDTRDVGSIPGSGRSLGEENGRPLQYSCLKNPKDRGAWRAAVQRVAKSQTQLSNCSHTHTHNVYISVLLSICPTLSFPCCVHKSIVCVCVPIPALQIGSSVPFF